MTRTSAKPRNPLPPLFQSSLSGAFLYWFVAQCLPSRSRLTGWSPTASRARKALRHCTAFVSSSCARATMAGPSLATAADCSPASSPWSDSS